MIVKKSMMKDETIKNMRGGEGIASLSHFDSKENMKNSRLACTISLPPGASIGEHEHINETEYYVILKGNGKVIDNGKEEPVETGEVVITPHGSKHSIINTGKTDLEFIAFIVTYQL